MNLEQNIQLRIEQWLLHTDTHTQGSIRQMIADGKIEELREAFFQDLEFGTGGLRGMMGIGTSRMNTYTVGGATQGLANYLKQVFVNQDIKIAISYDSRHRSKEFAQIVANVFSANDIKVYLFDDLRPTPQLSFASRYFGCQSAVMVTASHNPKEYNGYKAYWNDGGQLVSPHDTGVIEEVKKVSIQAIRFEAKPEFIQTIKADFDEIYLKKVQTLSLYPELIRDHKDLKIVYTSLHGTGIRLIPTLLKNLGFEQVSVVKLQEVPDGDFPTLIYPNPEEAEALTLALGQAEEIGADLVLATDPDADRVGIAVRNYQNKFVLLNGNQTGSLLMYYLMKAWKEKGLLTGNEYIVKTIVTTDLIDRMAEKFGIICYNTYTGFKYIASLIREHEGSQTYIAGCEESYGYLVGDFVRDKDAVSACGLIAEMTAYAQAYHGGLYAMLMQLYEEFGTYEDRLVSITKKGIAGIQEIKDLMQKYRTQLPKTLGGSAVILLRDYQTLQETDLTTGVKTILDGFPETSNVLQFVTAEGSKISARPSGTEPKIKFYVSMRSTKNKEDKSVYFEQKFQQIKADLGL